MMPRIRPLLCAALAALASCGPAADVSAPCDSDDDCATGECYTDSTPGYCTAVCETEGSTSECPDETVCKNIVGGPSRCILLCESDLDCPDNADCNEVEGGLAGCEPVR